MPEKHVEYFYKEGKSDKVYRIHLNEQFNDKWSVTFEYGRRGSSLTKRDKLQKVPYETAKELFDEMCHERELKGYTQEAGVKPYVGSDKEGKISGVLPQLLNDITEDLDFYFDSDDYLMQEKMDGKRILIQKKGVSVAPINRKGLFVAIPEEVVNVLKKVESDFIIDGELVGDIYHCFDILSLGMADCKELGFYERYNILIDLLAANKITTPVNFVPCHYTPKEKRAFFKFVKAARGEGIVFKLKSAPYKIGRPNSGGDQLRYKFKQQATVQVSGLHEKGKRSAYIQCLDGDKLVDIGKVTILPNFDMPKIGDLLEVEYLNRNVHGALYQPVLLKVRDDKDEPDDVKTLKVKQGVEIEEES